MQNIQIKKNQSKTYSPRNYIQKIPPNFLPKVTIMLTSNCTCQSCFITVHKYLASLLQRSICKHLTCSTFRCDAVHYEIYTQSNHRHHTHIHTHTNLHAHTHTHQSQNVVLGSLTIMLDCTWPMKSRLDILMHRYPSSWLKLSHYF